MDSAAAPSLWALGTTLVALSLGASLVLTWPASALLLHVYRGAVHKGMLLRGDRGVPRVSAPTDIEAAPDGRGSPGRVELTVVEPDVTNEVLARSRARSRAARRAFVVAGLGFGVCSAVAFFLRDGVQPTLRQVISLAPLLSWLAVPTVLAVGVRSTWHQARVVLAYAAFVAGALLVGGLPPAQLVVALGLLFVLPAAFVLLAGARGIRAVAWLVAPSLTVVLLAAFVGVVLAMYATSFGVDPNAIALAGVVVGLFVLAATYGWGVAQLNARGWASDETLRVLQWWVLLTLFQVVVLQPDTVEGVLVALSPLGVFLVALHVATAPLRRSAPPRRLLLLRTFGARERSSRLLRDLSVRWRWVGTIQLIAGPDLAGETLEPGALLAFLRRRLARRFVTDPPDARLQAAADTGVRPDRDGRFRVGEVLCRDDTWRSVLGALIDEADVVLIDLRDFSVRRLGVVYELEQLIARFPLDRVVAVIDATTNMTALTSILDDAFVRAPAQAPIRSDPRPALRIFPASGRRVADADALLQAVTSAASTAPQAAARGPVVA